MSIHPNADTTLTLEELNQLSIEHIFQSLCIKPYHVHAFKEAGLEAADLSMLPEAELLLLLPPKGPRSRLTRYFDQAAKNSAQQQLARDLQHTRIHLDKVARDVALLQANMQRLEDTASTLASL